MTTDLAYIAGFFDGEGSILISAWKSGRRDLHVLITNTDRDALEMIRSFFGCGVIRSETGTKRFGKKPCFNLRWTSASAERVLRELYPFLRVKKGKAETALKFRETFTRRHCGVGVPADIVQEREALWREIRVH